MNMEIPGFSEDEIRETNGKRIVLRHGTPLVYAPDVSESAYHDTPRHFQSYPNIALNSAYSAHQFAARGDGFDPEFWATEGFRPESREEFLEYLQELDISYLNETLGCLVAGKINIHPMFRRHFGPEDAEEMLQMHENSDWREEDNVRSFVEYWKRQIYTRTEKPVDEFYRELGADTDAGL